MRRNLHDIKIIKIEKRKCGKPTFNLAVEGDESYIAGGYAVHNCRSVILPITKREEGWYEVYAAQKPLKDWQVPQDGF